MILPPAILLAPALQEGLTTTFAVEVRSEAHMEATGASALATL